jgi:hypothetical protein
LRWFCFSLCVRNVGGFSVFVGPASETKSTAGIDVGLPGVSARSVFRTSVTGAALRHGRTRGIGSANHEHDV